MLPTHHLSQFLPWVMPHAAGVPFPQALQALHDAAIEFCERTKLWRYTMEIALDEQDSVIVAPQFTSIVEIEAATFNDVELTPILWVDSQPRQLQAVPVTGFPHSITQITADSVAVTPYMDGTLRVSVFLRPANGEQYGFNPENPLENAFHVVPEFIFAHHAQLIACGALAKILMVPNKSYTEPKLAAYHGQMFEKGLRDLASANKKGQQSAPLRVPARFM